MQKKRGLDGTGTESVEGKEGVDKKAKVKFKGGSDEMSGDTKASLAPSFYSNISMSSSTTDHAKIAKPTAELIALKCSKELANAPAHVPVQGILSIYINHQHFNFLYTFYKYYYFYFYYCFIYMLSFAFTTILLLLLL